MLRLFFACCIFCFVSDSHPHPVRALSLTRADDSCPCFSLAASGETEVVPLTAELTAEAIFSAVSDSKLPEPKLKAIARHIEAGRAYDARKRAQLRAERSNKASSKSASDESSERA